MFKNIGKTLRVFSIVLAVISFLGFAALGTLMLLTALDPFISQELYVAGMQAAIICYALAIITPFLDLILYGFGTMISAAQSQAEDSRKTREMLQTALSDGMLSEEIARKSGQVQAKLIAQLLAQAPSNAAPRNTRAPMQRPVEEAVTAPVAPQMPVEAPVAAPTPVAAPVTEPEPATVQKEETATEETPLAPAPAFIPIKPVTPFPVTPVANATVLRPLSGEDETF